jgi:hypothetical protein
MTTVTDWYTRKDNTSSGESAVGTGQKLAGCVRLIVSFRRLFKADAGDLYWNLTCEAAFNS